MQVLHGFADSPEGLGVAVVVEADGLAAAGVIGALVAAARLGRPRPVEADIFD